MIKFIVYTLFLSQFPVMHQGRIHPSCLLEGKWEQHLSENPADPTDFVENLKPLPPVEIAAILETEYPIRERLLHAGSTFFALPGRYQKGEWFPLNALKCLVYSPESDSLERVGNFTLYSDEQFQRIQSLYLNAKREELFKELNLAYRQLAGKPLQQASGKTFYYPSMNQLYAEKLLLQFPFLKVLLLLYLLALVWPRAFFAAFSLHTIFLLIRCYVLYRPPVSNMYETLLFVPWVIAIAGLLFKKKRTAALAICLLFTTLLLGNLTDKMENVQAVLDSQLWLTTHVLMVVGSYGFFIFAALIAHFKNPNLTYLLYSLYIGTGLLIVGTILGGVWAAQSWGRFWDWDPKESWAFVSACTYLILIHLYQFKHIGLKGLSIGAILGLQAITFTWYGVNYILGTGLHSYGFGSGGTKYYCAFVLFELGFVILNLSLNRKRVTILP